MKRKIFSSTINVLAALMCLLIGTNSFGQNTITASPDDTICAPGSATLTATVVLGPNAIAGTGLTLGDDSWSALIPIGFTFNFFGVPYTNVVIGSNNILTFDASQANQFCPWSISAPIPSTANPTNSIMCPYEDLFPSPGNEVYATIGTAPNRIFVISYCSSPMFQCNNLFYTGSVMLYEGTDVIETHTSDKYLCSTWNGGAAIHGIQNATGTVAYVVPGRNFPTQWTATNDGYRWTPGPAATYTGAAIPYAPIVLSSTAMSVQWYDSNGWGVGSGTTITVSPSVTTTYTAVLPSCSGAVSDSVTVVVNSITVDAGVDDTICPGFPSQLNATSPDPVTSWSWSPPTALSNPNIANPIANPTVTTTYTVTGTMGNCTTSDDVTIVVSSSSITYTSAQTNPLCNSNCNGTATVNVTSTNGPFTYAWSPSGGNGPTASNLCAGTYSCVISAGSGCQSLQTFTITQPPALSVAMTSFPSDCDTSNGTATAATTGGVGPYNYLWSDGQTTQTAIGLAPATYTVVVTDANSCAQTQTVTVAPPAAIIPAVVALPPGYIQGGNTQLTAAGGTTYQWSPITDLSCDTCPDPIASPSLTTTYCVRISDSTTNCYDSICITIDVEIPCNSGGLEKLMPNAFSPNNDGTNDKFCIPYNVCISKFDLKIYDRWGARVFQTTSMTECWDGTYKGEPLSKGLYVYYFDAVLSTGEEFHKQGNISLIK